MSTEPTFADLGEDRIGHTAVGEPLTLRLGTAFGTRSVADVTLHRPRHRDGFMDALEAIAKEAVENPELLASAPHTTPVRRVDEVYAAKALILSYKDMLNEEN